MPQWLFCDIVANVIIPQAPATYISLFVTCGMRHQKALCPSDISNMRPEFIIRNNCKEFILIHDEGYLAAKRAWKRKLASVHPDKRRFLRPEAPLNLHTYDNCMCGNVKLTTSKQCASCYYQYHTGAFRTARAQYRAWLEHEHQWYQERGLEPPDYKGHKTPSTERKQLCLLSSGNYFAPTPTIEALIESVDDI
jgi:hypothetical protein